MMLTINRTFENDKQTIGQMHVIENNRSIFSCNTLELPNLENESNISCIPRGDYMCHKRTSPKFGLSFIIEDVPNREYILIHPGNYHSEIRGCVLVGKYFKDINGDGYTDVVSSGDTVKKLLAILPDRFELHIG